MCQHHHQCPGCAESHCKHAECPKREAAPELPPQMEAYGYGLQERYRWACDLLSYYAKDGRSDQMRINVANLRLSLGKQLFAHGR